MKLLLAPFLFLLFLSGCDTFTAALDYFKNAGDTLEAPPLYKNRADIEITINGETFDGIATTDLKPEIKIEIESKARLYVLTIETCSRHLSYSRVDKTWYGGVGKKFKYTFKPNSVEADGNCPMFIKAIDLNGVSAWGMVQFKTNETINAILSCNGQNQSVNGLSFCQTKHSLIQEITFLKPIERFIAGEFCTIEKKTDLIFEVRPKLGFCFATFLSGGEVHRLTILGYESVFVRGE